MTCGVRTPGSKFQWSAIFANMISKAQSNQSHHWLRNTKATRMRTATSFGIRPRSNSSRKLKSRRGSSKQMLISKGSELIRYTRTIRSWRLLRKTLRLLKSFIILLQRILRSTTHLTEKWKIRIKLIKDWRRMSWKKELNSFRELRKSSQWCLTFLWRTRSIPSWTNFIAINLKNAIC